MSRANPRFRRQNQKLPVPAFDVYRVKLVGSIENQLTINTLYYFGPDAVGAGTGVHVSNLAAALQLTGGVQQKYLTCMSADWAMVGMTIDIPTTPSIASTFFATAGAGSGPAGHEPTEVGAVILRTTGFKGQCGHGRLTLPAVPTTWVTASRITTSTNYLAFIVQAGGSITSGGDTFSPCLLSRNGSRAFPGVGAAAVTQFSLITLLGTVRRRKIGRGK